MEAIFYLSIIAILLLVPATITALVWPGFFSWIFRGFTKRRYILPSIAATFVVLCLVTATAEPQSLKDEQLAKEKAAQTQQTQKQTTPKVKGAATTKPKVETKTEAKTEAIPFASEQRNDSTLAKGKTKIIQVGVNGERTITYSVTYTDGKETARTQTSDAITKQPVSQITAIGTYVAPVARPTPAPAPSTNPSGATARCVDGTLSYSAPSPRNMLPPRGC